MKNYYILLLIAIIVSTAPVYAYEASRQLKIDTVNSYQPTQFDGQNNDSLKKELLDLKFQTTQSRDLYIETMPVDVVGKQTSPISKNDYPVYAIKEKQGGFVKSFDEDFPNPQNFWNNDQDIALEGSVFQEDKPRKKIFTKQKWNTFCTFIKGVPADDALLLGQQSIHTSKERDHRNNTNNMLAVQYGGVAAGYFYNSWYRDTYFLTVARKVWKKEYKHDMSIDFQYKAGIMHGYKDEAPIQLGWIEPVIIPSFGFNYKKSGFDLIIVPSAAPVFAVNFRLAMPEPMTYKSVHAKIAAKHPPKLIPATVDQYQRIDVQPSPVSNPTKLQIQDL